MSKEMTTQTNMMQPVTEQTVKDYLFGSKTELTDQEKALFLNIATRNDLDPFKKEIYVVKYGGTFDIITGYRVYIDRAERSGKLNGWEVEEQTTNGKLTSAKLTIHRKDWAYPFHWSAKAAEFNKGKSTWKTMPSFMLKKVAIAQGFRVCFPSECGNLPYTAEEQEFINMGEVERVETKATIINPLQDKIDAALYGFASLGCSKSKVESMVGLPAENWTEDTLSSLRGKYTDLKAPIDEPEPAPEPEPEKNNGKTEEMFDAEWKETDDFEGEI